MMTDKRPRGRPRKPEAMSATARVAAMRAAKISEGGARREFLLSSSAIAALSAIRARDGDASDKDVIERLLIAAVS